MVSGSREEGGARGGRKTARVPTANIITGAVLLAAVTIDAVARRTREAAGRA
jgi:hypothetical protein